MEKLTKNILFVEDSDAIGVLVPRILNGIELNGFNFIAKWESDSHKAMEIIKNREECIDLVITDNIMPHVSGVEIIEAVLRNRPGIPIVGVSGDVDHFKKDIVEKLGKKCPNIIIFGVEDQSQHFPKGDILLLTKPFKKDDIHSMLECIFG